MDLNEFKDLTKDDKIKSNVENLELYSDTFPFKLPLRIKNFNDEKYFIKFIKKCESGIRGSLEYRHWKDYIIDVLGINKCMITSENTAERFFITCTACAATSPSTRFPVSGSSAICPEQKMKPPAATACEYGPIAPGAFVVSIIFFVICNLTES